MKAGICGGQFSRDADGTIREEFWRVDAVEGTVALTPAHPRPGAAVGPAGLARGPVTSGRRGRGRLPHPLNRRRPIHAPRPLRAAPGRHGRILLVRAVEVASRHRWEPRDVWVVPGERREASRGYRRVARAGGARRNGCCANIYLALKLAPTVEQSGSLAEDDLGLTKRRAGAHSRVDDERKTMYFNWRARASRLCTRAGT